MCVVLFVSQRKIHYKMIMVQFASKTDFVVDVFIFVASQKKKKTL